jgi:hypothetical protein
MSAWRRLIVIGIREEGGRGVISFRQYGTAPNASGTALHRKRHVQGVEYQPGGECRGRRPADDPTAARIQHHEIKAPYELIQTGKRSYLD